MCLLAIYNLLWGNIYQSSLPVLNGVVLFTFLKIFFNLQKFQTLMKSNIAVYFVTHILDVISTNTLPNSKL